MPLQVQWACAHSGDKVLVVGGQLIIKLCGNLRRWSCILQVGGQMKGLCQFSCDLNKDLDDWVGNVLCRCSFIMSAFGLCFQGVSRICPPLPISTTSILPGLIPWNLLSGLLQLPLTSSFCFCSCFSTPGYSQHLSQYDPTLLKS